jgi:predicted DCC family thiol-disulfide oxidoreductase YuxK
MAAVKEKKPLLIFDGDCGFCKRWIALWEEMTDGAVRYASSQEVGKNYPQIPPEQFENSVVFVLPSGKFSVGAEAVFLSLAQAPQLKWAHALAWAYRSFPGFAPVTEFFYARVAQNRIFFSYLTYYLFGEQIERSTYALTRWIFLRALGFVYLLAFASLGSQIAELVGVHGLVKSTLSAASYQGICFLGGLGSIFLMAGVAPLLLLVALWGIYFFLAQSCGEFLWFQWDGLMLEMGFLAIFFAPLSFRFQSPATIAKDPAPSSIILFLLRWLLFRVIFFSGWVKLASGDLAWRELTAISYHYETQPLPTWVGWYAHQLPMLFHQFSAVILFGIELIISFFIFLPRRPRIWAFFILVGFQLLINLTGNYGFFGWQIAALSLLLLDDVFWRNVLPKKWTGFLRAQSKKVEPEFKQWINYGLAAAVLLLSIFHFRPVSDWIDHCRIVNRYGVFAVMTTQREEIILEGSLDGKNWREYSFKWKPGDLKAAPRFAGPHMPRLDWQMWFAALSKFEDNPWLEALMQQLLRGSPSTSDLLANDPFVGTHPQFIRAVRYAYHFTDWRARHETGNWWARTRLGEYSPILSAPNNPLD